MKWINPCSTFPIVWISFTSRSTQVFFYLQLEKRNDKNSDMISNHWAEDGTFTVEDLQISQTESYDSPAYRIRSFTLTKKGNPVDRLIKHFHFTSWHNFGLPKNVSLFLSFIRIINKWNEIFRSKKVSILIDFLITSTMTFLTDAKNFMVSIWKEAVRGRDRKSTHSFMYYFLYFS